MRASVDLRNKTLITFLLLVIIAGGYVFRTVFATAVMPPPLRMQGETTQAYRYTALVSSGEGIPAVDSLVMRPDGMITGQNSIFEEYLAGGIHYLTGGDLNRFLWIFSRLFPLFSIPVLFLWMKNTGFNSGESFTGAVLYSVILPALLRTRGESLYRETVALPIIFAALMLADIARGKEARRALYLSAGGALLFFCALAAWKVTTFLAFLLFSWFTITGAKKTTVIPFAAAQLLASLTLSHMIHDGAFHSPATVMAVASVVSSVTGKQKICTWIGICLAILTSVLFQSSSTGHVTSVMVAKIRFFFSHPENPLLLEDDARLFWVSGYTSPSPGQIILLFGAALAVSLSGIRRYFKQASGTLLLWLFPVSIAGYLLFDRLHVILAFGIIPPVIAALRGNKFLLAGVVALFGTLTMYAPAEAEFLSDSGLEFGGTGSLLTDGELTGLLSWSGEHRGTVLSYWHISGLLSAYAETPVVTHTFFESRENRETIVEFARRIYGTEDEMAAFMEEKGALYLVYQADFIFDRSPQGLLYLAGLTEIPDGSLAIRLHYYPESLARLAPVWQGPSLRVFALDEAPADSLKRYVLWDRDYGRFISDYPTAFSAVMSPVETGLYLGGTGMETGDADKISAALLLLAASPDEVPADASIELLQNLLMAHLYGEYPLEKLADDFETYLDAWGPDPQLRLDLIRLLQNGEMNERAEHHITILQNTGRQGS